ncbi:peptide chain release factor H [Halocynthiibacter sp.]|uniref:peptide chain release factor H n=1 Tax=Halocynthiibacter sp. TaxID=1979210 RepID=UPI003C612EEA
MSEQMTLLVTSGNGPEECCQAVAHILQRMQAEADEMGADLDISGTPSDHGMKSAVVVVHGPLADRFALAWCGSIRWICKSDLRKGYKRQNWFAGVIRLPDLSAKVQGTEGIRFETFRAGGPGGQHQNTTDSAVRATCQQSGLSVVVRDGRSQHRNKALAIERLATLKALQADQRQAIHAKDANLLHHQLERGNAHRIFRGKRFVEA